MAFWAQATGPGVQGCGAVPLHTPGDCPWGLAPVGGPTGLAPAWAGFSEPCWAVNKTCLSRLSPVPSAACTQEWRLAEGAFAKGRNGGDKATRHSATGDGQSHRRPSRCAWLLAVLAAGVEGGAWSLQLRHPLLSRWMGLSTTQHLQSGESREEPSGAEG